MTTLLVISTKRNNTKRRMMYYSKMWIPSPVHFYPSSFGQRCLASALWERSTASGQRWFMVTSPERCLLHLGMTCLRNPWWSRPSERIFRSQQVYMRLAYKAAPLWVFPHWGKGTFWIISVPKPTLLNGASFPREFLIETSLATYNMLYNGWWC